MKSPREILLGRHQGTGPKLDAIRESAVAAVCDRRDSANRAGERRARGAATTVWQTLWRELILPSRRIWAGLAACWVMLAVANLSLNGHSTVRMAKSTPSPEMILAYRQQETLLAELIGANEPRIAERPKLLPRPRSERRHELFTA